LGAVTSVGLVLPGMLARKSGTVLITTGISARAFMPMIGAWGMAGSAVRNYARTLNAAVRDKGIFVSVIVLGVQIKEGDQFGDPNLLAETYFALYRDRDRPEVFINHLPPNAVELDGGNSSK
jgi:NADP-dependent 3-hydroxy acid dehydrogenase YdfG